MSASGPTSEGGAEAVVSRRRGISPIWLIPIVESALGVVRAFDIATAADSVVAA